MSTIAIIPARGGSRRIPHKNIRAFHGKPIIMYSVEAARASNLFDRIVVTTDDPEIGALAIENGLEVCPRSPGFEKDEVGTQEVVRDCLIQLGYSAFPHDHDPVCCIYATAPLMLPSDLQYGYTIFQHNAMEGYAFSVSYPPLQDAGQFYWGLAYHFVKEIPLINSHTRLVHIPDERVCDINTEADWNRALKMYRELHK